MTRHSLKENNDRCPPEINVEAGQRFEFFLFNEDGSGVRGSDLRSPNLNIPRPRICRIKGSKVTYWDLIPPRTSPTSFFSRHDLKSIIDHNTLLDSVRRRSVNRPHLARVE